MLKTRLLRRGVGCGAAKAAAATLLATAIFMPAAALHAQDSDAVSVDLGALDNLDRARAPAQITLTPPPGISPINRAGGSAIKLKPPASARAASMAKIAPAPRKPDAPSAAVAEAPPRAAMPAPTPAPRVEPVDNDSVAAIVPPAPAPDVQPKAETVPQPTPTVPIAPVPSPAAARSAATETAGPAVPFGAAAPGDDQQSASLPAQNEMSGDEPAGDTRSLSFAAGSAEVSSSIASEIMSMAERMSNDRSLRLQLLAYASDAENNTSRARRLALDRAVAVRNMLIDAGVERTRIEVRALGDQADSGPPDRVDAVAVQR